MSFSGTDSLSTAPVLEVRGLTKQYARVLAANQVSFTVGGNGAGEIFALIGPNGAGKTTTIRMIATLITPTDGDAFICGHSVVKEPGKVRELITYLPDEAGAYKSMTGRSYLNFMAEMVASDSAQIPEFCTFAEGICKLGDRLDDRIASYSRGMIRKLLLARAVMSRPKLAILDEPTSGLDVINALEIRKMIRELSAAGMSFLISSHNMLEIEFISDNVGIIAGGVVRAMGKPAELKNRYGASNLEEVFEYVVNSAGGAGVTGA